MTRMGSAAKLGCALAALALFASACTSQKTQPLSTDRVVKGGTFRITAVDYADGFDPGKVSSPFGLMLFRVMVRTLVASPAQPGPAALSLTQDLATDTGTVSSDGLSWTFTLRDGVKYQSDVAGGREVRSADIRYAIERGFFPSVASPMAAAHFTDLFAGDEEFVKAPAPGKNITGIDVSNPKRIVFRLKRPTGDLGWRLSLPIAAPVPEEYARVFDAKAVSEYGPNFASTGPYQIERGAAGSGGGPVRLVRNAAWAPATDPIRKAYPDRIEVSEGVDSTLVGTDSILRGEFDYNADFAIPADRIDVIRANRAVASRLFVNPGRCINYVALNTTIKPFDSLKVRQAFAFALDRQAMRLQVGGEAAGEIAGSMIPPGTPGFEESGGREFDVFDTPEDSGDRSRSTNLMREAGFASGTYQVEGGGERPVRVVGASTGANPRVTKEVVDALTHNGIQVELEQYAPNIALTNYVGIPREDVAVAPSLRRCADYPDPNPIVTPLFDGLQIKKTGNANISLINDPELNTLLEQARGARWMKRLDLWADANKSVMDKALVVPWLAETVSTLISSRVVNFQFTPASSSIDLAVVAIRGGK